MRIVCKDMIFGIRLSVSLFPLLRNTQIRYAARYTFDTQKTRLKRTRFATKG